MSLRVSLPTAPDGPRSLLRRFLSVPFRAQTYVNLLYLSLFFPVGLAYFIALTVGFALGISLTVLLVGTVLTIAMVYLVRELTALERFVADRALVVDVPAGNPDPPSFSSPLQHVKYVFTTLSTWKGLVYLVSKLFVGIGAFTLLLTLSTISLSMVAVPLYYENVRFGVHPATGDVAFAPSIEFALQTWQIGLTIPFRITTWYVTTLPGALAVSVVGILATIASLHVCNVAARLTGWYASLLLGGTEPSSIRRLLDV